MGERYMRIVTHVCGYKPDGTIGMVPYNGEIPLTYRPSLISIDGSTDCTGISVVDLETCGCVYSVALHNDCKDPITYKVQFKQYIEKLLAANKNHIKVTSYEEPFFGYAEASKVLMALRTTVKEVLIEKKDEFKGIFHIEVNNKRWKAKLLHPEKCPPRSAEQKKAVRKKIESYIPDFKNLTQDECDSYGLGYVTAVEYKKGTLGELNSKKKVKPFKFNAEFIGFESFGEEAEDQVLNYIYGKNKEYKIPKRVLDNGFDVVYLDGTGKFSQRVCEEFGDDDKVLIVGFSNKKYGNIALEHNIGWLFEEFECIYAVCWRASRKY